MYKCNTSYHQNTNTSAEDIISHETQCTTKEWWSYVKTITKNKVQSMQCVKKPNLLTKLKAAMKKKQSWNKRYDDEYNTTMSTNWTWYKLDHARKNIISHRRTTKVQSMMIFNHNNNLNQELGNHQWQYLSTWWNKYYIRNNKIKSWINTCNAVSWTQQ
mgnify:CR=1 FL=1